jgi:hypothetical protein
VSVPRFVDVCYGCQGRYGRMSADVWARRVDSCGCLVLGSDLGACSNCTERVRFFQAHTFDYSAGVVHHDDCARLEPVRGVL